MRLASIRTIGLTLAVALTAGAQRFYPDDPLQAEPPPRSIPDVKSRKLSDFYDFFSHQFGDLGEQQPVKGPPIRAQAVNTLGEPYEGAWWVQRHYYKRMTAQELKRGAGETRPSEAQPWKVIAAKTEGVTPGFVVIDGEGRRFFIKFDPLSNPEMATAADAISSRLFHAMGYHVPQNHIVSFDRDRLQLGEDVQVPDQLGRPRKMTERDLVEILLKVPKGPDGRYRATASLAIEGRTIGPPRYYGTRKDDPNDIVPHEHRRDQRGLHVIDAWLGHDDSRAINNLDVVVAEGGKSYIKHYHLDFGSTLGSGTQRANSPRSGAYLFNWSDAAVQFFTLGLAPQYWALADYPDFPSVGLFEWKRFDPERWVPEYPNPAFQNRLPDDEFWGAKLVTAFRDDDIRAIVETAELTNKAAEAWLFECLRERRDKVGRAYFAKVLPLDKFRIENGNLAWNDLGADLGYADKTEVSMTWVRLDNRTEATTPIAGASGPAIPRANDGYSCARIVAEKRPGQSVEVCVQHSGAAARVVGVERNW